MDYGYRPQSIIDNAMESANITQSDMWPESKQMEIFKPMDDQVIVDQAHNSDLKEMFISMNDQEIVDQPPNSDLNHESIRQMSLLSWINMHVSKEKLARYGFYYNLESDYVKCFFCEVVIGEWGVGDDPLTEHHKHSPDCVFINLKPTNNVPSRDAMQLRNELKEMLESLKPRGRSCAPTELVPRHPDYKDEATRLESYYNWPKFMRQTPKDLSAAGFFYLGVGDEVKCFFCGGCLKDWETTDSPIQEHKKHFYDQCRFIKKNYQGLKREHSINYTKNLVKATPHQINELTKYMNQHPDLKDGKINLGSNKTLYNQLWSDLTEYLNSFDGPKKNTKAWKEVWRNHKYNSKRRGDALPTTADLTDEEIAPKRIKMYHDYGEIQNHPNVEPDSTETRLEMYHQPSPASTPASTSSIIEYQPNFRNAPHTLTNSALELELQKQKCENERLQFEVLKLKYELEKRDLQQQLEAAKQELERTRLQTDNGISYLRLL